MQERQRIVMWRSQEQQSLEYCRLKPAPHGYDVEGVVLQTLNQQPVRCISIRDHCLVAMGVLGSTQYVHAADYWRAARGGKAVTEREAGCMLAHLDALKCGPGDSALSHAVLVPWAWTA